MVLPIIAPATIILISGLIRLIAWLGSIVFIAMYTRDIITKSKETDIQISSDKTVNDIIDDPDLTPEQKTGLLREYLDSIKDKDIVDWTTIVIIAGGAIVIAALISSGILGGKK